MHIKPYIIRKLCIYSVFCSALYAKCQYYLGLYMQMSADLERRRVPARDPGLDHHHDVHRDPAHRALAGPWSPRMPPTLHIKQSIRRTLCIYSVLCTALYANSLLFHIFYCFICKSLQAAIKASFMEVQRVILLLWTVEASLPPDQHSQSKPHFAPY